MEPSNTRNNGLSTLNNLDNSGLDNSGALRQADSSPTATSTDNKISRNIVIRALKFLADRIVSAIKFVWNKLSSSKSETNKEQPQVMANLNSPVLVGQEQANTEDDSFEVVDPADTYDYNKDRDKQQLVHKGLKVVTEKLSVAYDAVKDNLPSIAVTDQLSVAYDAVKDNLTSIAITEKLSVAYDAVKDNLPSAVAATAHGIAMPYVQTMQSKFFGDEQLKETMEDHHNPVLVGQTPPTHTEQKNTEYNNFEVVDLNIEFPNPADTYTYNRAHDKQQLVHQGIDRVTDTLSDACNVAKGNLYSVAAKVYGSFIPYFQGLERDIFNGKQLKEDMGIYISNFMKATDSNDDAPNDCVEEMIKFADNELKKLLCNQIDIDYKDLETVGKLAKIYAMLSYTTEKIKTTTDSNSRSKENLIQLNKKLDNIYKSCFADFISYSHKHEIVATTREAADKLNTYLGKIFGSKYTLVEINWDRPDSVNAID